MSEKPQPAEKPKLRWYQYRLSHLFVLMVVVAVACAFGASWWAWYPPPWVEYRRAAAPIERLRGYVHDGRPDRGAESVTNIYFFDVAFPLTDADLEALSRHLETLPNLKRLQLCDMQVTDAGLEHLKGLTKLECLDLWYTQVTNDGVEKLQQALPNCRIYFDHGEHEAAPTIWVCPMGHPDIQLPDPGHCPIDCMELMPTKGEWHEGD